MALFSGLVFIAALICMLVFLILIVLDFIKKQSPKKHSIYLLISFGVLIVSMLLGASTTKDHKTTTKEVTVTKKVNTTKSDNDNVAKFKSFMDTDPSASEFLKEYYGIKPVSDQSVIWDKLLANKEVSWTGTVIEPMSTRIAVITEDKYDGNNWATIANSDSDAVSYSMFLRNVPNAKEFKAGDKIKFTGKLASRGSNLNGYKSQWDLDSVSVQKQ
ncbi:hypothetical protein QFC96_10640 (plasmid) [Latilactobacillus curvatus]|uniref:hypothetical protein n=1 Tax=Latilactobacillus curvatus TaxID=28038 RepID=UPI0024BBA9AB|nr:hypothetical protein [Latilactobacillus curvatus]WHQ77654.1 hypothetical protein QFC96_07075 [Latilactobacillus curvatus]WHQ79301.1 hypothetical protein QFC96_10640 [Latilactobacillus curvatus]